MQSKKMSALEALSNTIVGILIGFFIVYFFSPLIGFAPTVQQSIGLNAAFVVASPVRSYVIRRLFVWLEFRGV